MRLRDKIKSYSFWVSLASAIILILKILGTRFGFSIDESMISDLFTALCSILVLLGIIVVPSSGQTTQKQNTNENKQVQISQDETKQLVNKNSKFVDDSVLENKKAISESSIDIKDTTNKIEKHQFDFETNDEVSVNTEETIKEEKIEFSADNINSQNETISSSSKESIAEQNISTDIEEQNSIQEQVLTTHIETQEFETKEILNSSNLKSILEDEKKKFAGNLDLYIFELQEEIRKTREGM